jgi:hypothetical protein
VLKQSPQRLVFGSVGTFAQEFSDVDVGYPSTGPRIWSVYDGSSARYRIAVAAFVELSLSHGWILSFRVKITSAPEAVVVARLALLPRLEA